MQPISAKYSPKHKHLVIIIAYPGVNLLDISGPAQVFSSALFPDKSPYVVIVSSIQGGLIRTNSGVSIETTKLTVELCLDAQTILIAGGQGIFLHLKDHHMITLLKDVIKPHHRIGSICTGAFLLAATGYLNNKRVVTHWNRYIELKKTFPNVIVDKSPIFIKDENTWSSAGVTSGIDLALAMVEEDYGRATALTVARDLVVYLKRPGGQNQYSSALHLQISDKSGHFDDLHSWVSENIDKDLSLERLAEFMNMSTRNFARIYKQKTDITPRKAVEIMRIEAARNLLENTDFTVQSIAKRCGLETEKRLRLCFMRHLDINPSDYRERFGINS